MERSFGTIKSGAMGLDGISLNMLKLVFFRLLNQITFIINTCIISSHFPIAWKQARVVALPKTADPTEFSQLRPVSVLPTISKVLERILFNQLKQFVDNNNIISAHQSGFREHHSSTTVLVHIGNEICGSIDDNKLMCLVLLDYTRAFDTLDHKILCNKLKYFGMDSDSVCLVNSFLSNRTQRVAINNVWSEPLELKQGVPQGSLLGPLLFSIYISDFWEAMSYCKVHHYADDTQIWYSFSETEVSEACDAINYDLGKLYSISQAHKLNLNANKSAVMLFGRGKVRETVKPTIDIKIHGSKIGLAAVWKNLGLYIDENFRFSTHVNTLCKSSYYVLKNLFPHRKILPNNLKLSLCYSLIISRLSYGDVVYGPTLLSRDANRLQRIQNSCFRFAFGIRKYEQGVSAIIANTKNLKLDRLRSYHLLCMAHKVIMNRSPVYVLDKLNCLHTNATAARTLRHLGLLRIPHHKTAFYERSFAYQAPLLYNKIPRQIKNCSLRNFKKRLKEYLLTA